MNWIIDILVLLLIAHAAYRGYYNGLVVELCGVLGVIVGAYVAYKFSNQLAPHMKLPIEVAQVLAFIAIFIAIIVLVIILGRVLSKLLSFSGLGVINGLLGLAVSLFKTVAVLSLLVSSFVSINSRAEWVKPSTINKSEAVPKLLDVSHALFPYIDFMEVYYDKFVESLEKTLDR